MDWTQRGNVVLFIFLVFNGGELTENNISGFLSMCTLPQRVSGYCIVQNRIHICCHKNYNNKNMTVNFSHRIYLSSSDQIQRLLLSYFDTSLKVFGFKFRTVYLLLSI
jgi:hypothetical protein